MENEIRDNLIVNNIGLVYYIVNTKHKNKSILMNKYGIEKEDLEQIGMVGLIKAADRYNAEYGTFGNYASKLINGEIRRYFRDKGNIIKFSRSCKEIEAKFAVAKIPKDEITIERIIEFIGCTIKVATQAYEYMNLRDVLTIDKPAGSDADGKATNFVDLLRADNEDENFNLYYKEFLSLLKDNERLTVELTMAGLSQREVSKIVGVSQVHVGRLLKKAKNVYITYSGGELCKN